MRSLLIDTAFIVAVAFMISPVLLAQNRTAPADISGMWDLLDSEDSNGDTFTYEEPSMTPWAEKRYKLIREDVEGFNQARGDLDQLLWPYCMMPGIPRAYLRPGPIEIIQTEKGIYMIFEGNKAARQIYLDGRGHPVGAPATFMGHSIGRWDGDALVAETVQLNELTWLDGVGHPHTSALRIEERFRRIAPDRLEISFLFEDPGAYTEPWRGKKEFELHNDWTMVEYGICIDQSQQEYLEMWKGVLGEDYLPASD